MLGFFTVLIMLAVGYAHFREGIFTALTTLVNVIIAGLITFNFYEPLANLLDTVFAKSFMAGVEDYLVMVTLFCGTLALLRVAANNLANRTIEFPAALNQIGGAGVGLITGYLASGFIVCLLQTIPWHQNFLEFSPRAADEGGLRRLLPADRVWLSLMRHAGAASLSRGPIHPEQESGYDRFNTFDAGGTFELRYFRYRRYSDQRGPINYLGELQYQLHP